MSNFYGSFFTLIFAVLLVGTTFITRPSTYLRFKVQLPTSDSTEITASGPKITLGALLPGHSLDRSENIFISKASTLPYLIAFLISTSSW